MAAKLTLQSTQKLLSGYQIPVLGYGVYQTPTDVAEEVTVEALKLGYRHVPHPALSAIIHPIHQTNKHPG
jgi:hypothetical protein